MCQDKNEDEMKNEILKAWYIFYKKIRNKNYLKLQFPACNKNKKDKNKNQSQRPKK